VEFRLRCECGNEIVVTEGSAGADVRCDCGRVVAVPGLKQLRLQAGLPAYDPSPELLIEHILAAKELPVEESCVECGAATDQIAEVLVECEEAWIREKGGFNWWLLLLSGGHIFSWSRKEERAHGYRKAYGLPLRLCSTCQRGLSSRAKIKECLRNVPLYRRLLDKFPDAKVSVQSR
jgi:hypothetical protein